MRPGLAPSSPEPSMRLPESVPVVLEIGAWSSLRHFGAEVIE